MKFQNLKYTVVRKTNSVGGSDRKPQSYLLGSSQHEPFGFVTIFKFNRKIIISKLQSGETQFRMSELHEVFVFVFS